MNVATQDPGAFTEDQAAKITGLSTGQLAYWARTDLFPASHPAESGPLRRIYSFRDLVGLRTVASLREMGVSVQELRKLGDWLRREHETPWASLRFWIGPKKKVYFSDPDSGTPLTVGPPYQGGIPVALDQIAAQVRAKVDTMRTRTPEQFGVVERNRNVMGNAPVFAGTRILVQSVREMLEDGLSEEEILKEFPTLGPSDVATARSGLRKTA